MRGIGAGALGWHILSYTGALALRKNPQDVGDAPIMNNCDDFLPVSNASTVLERANRYIYIQAS